MERRIWEGENLTHKTSDYIEQFKVLRKSSHMSADDAST